MGPHTTQISIMRPHTTQIFFALHAPYSDLNSQLTKTCQDKNKINTYCFV